MALTEEQQAEYDMLQAMFPEHVQEVQCSPSGLPQYTLSISVAADAPVEVLVTVTLPVDYPATAPPMVTAVSVSVHRMVSVDPLIAKLEECALENEGMHCVAIMLQTAQEFLRDLDSAKAVRVTDAVDVDPTIRLGNPVTLEVFEEWKNRHRAEKAARRAAQLAKEQEAIKGKLTGRQFFDATIKNADWALFEASTDEGDAVDLDYDLRDEEADPSDTENPETHNYN